MDAGVRLGICTTRQRCMCMAIWVSASVLGGLISADSALAVLPDTIASQGKGAGGVEIPLSTAVDQSSGDVYVADRNNFRIDKFDAGGNFLLAWGFGVADGVTAELQTCGPESTPLADRCFGPSFSSSNGAGNILPQAVSVDQASGDVYVADANKHRITKFTPSGEFVFMVGTGVNAAPGTPHPNLCLAAEEASCTTGTSGTGPNEFSTPRSLAVSSSGIVWVGDSGRLKSFDSGGTAGAECVLSGAGNTQSLALDSAGNFYVKSSSLAGIRKLETGTCALLATFDAGGQPRTVTLDAANNVYVGDATSPYRFLKFGAAGEQKSQFGANQVLGSPGNESAAGANAISIGESAESLYVASSKPAANSFVQRFTLPEPGPLPENQHVEGLLPTSATLAAELSPEGKETSYHFEYGTSASYGQSTTTETLKEGGVPYEGFDEKPVSASLVGLAPETTYHFRLVATNSEGTVHGPDTIFTTLPAVAIDAQWATDVAAHSASLHVELDPLGVAGEWWIEYGTSPCSGGGCKQTAKALLPASFGDISVGAVLSGLESSTTYYYRFVASDERESTVYVVHGEDRAFTTQFGGLGFELADGRAWEMVSPPNKFGAAIVAFGEAQAQAAADGSALAYLSKGSIEENPEGNRSPEKSSVLAHRDAGGSWHSKDVTPPNAEVERPQVGFGQEYKLFSSDLSTALLEPRSTAPLSPDASERTPYLRQNTEPGTYTPLATGKEGIENVPLGTKFGSDPARLTSPQSAVQVRGASPDLSHVLVQGCVPLENGAGIGSLYEWTGGQFGLASVLPASEEGGHSVPAVPGSGNRSVSHAISTDGSRVFWTRSNASVMGSACGAVEETPGLYMRDLDRGESVRLDAKQTGAFGTGTPEPLFQGADATGTVAFFTDTQNLTHDANESGADLYRCEVEEDGEGHLKCGLTDLTAQTATATEAAEVKGVALGVSDDGSHAYFVATGVLSGENAAHESPVSGQPNLYLWQKGSSIRFIARLSEGDATDWGLSPTDIEKKTFNGYQQSAATSPGGRYLAFMSERSLTGYDNREAASGERLEEVFRYDAEDDQLLCASCNPAGKRPAGLRWTGNLLGPAIDPQALWQGRGLAATLPEADLMDFGVPISLYRPRAVQDDGRLFFNAADSLVGRDSNGQWDVYEFEPAGVGGCTLASGDAGTAQTVGGCVSLLSSGTAEEESAFIDASVGGNDVFFLSPAQLSALDEDQVTDVYDARVNGIVATRAVRTECLGEACQPAASAPSVVTPASATFRGAGNLSAPSKHCARGKRKVTRKGKSRCVPRKHRKRHRAHRRRGAGR